MHYKRSPALAKTFQTWPEMVDNVIPYIGGEEEKSEQEPLKIWGHIEDDKIVNAVSPSITSQCIRVQLLTATPQQYSFPLRRRLKWKKSSKNGKAIAQASGIESSSAPKQFIHYFRENDRPQIKSERNLEGGMAVSVGRLRPDTQYDVKFVSMSHNTLRGAAGGAVLMAELYVRKAI